MSTQLDDAIRDAVGDILDLAPAVPDDPCDIALTRHHPSRRGRSGVVAMAAAAFAVAGTAGLIVLQRPDDAPAPSEQPATSSVTDVTQPVSEVTSPAAAVSPQLYPAFPVGDPRNVGAQGMYAQIGVDNPAQTTAVVARREGEQLLGGISITAHSELRPDAFVGAALATVTVNGMELTAYIEQGTPAITTVILPGPLPVAISGLDPAGFLTAAGADVVAHAKLGTSRPNGEVLLSLGSLPAGYEVIVPPTPLPRGAHQATLHVIAAGNADGAGISVAVTNPIGSLVTVAAIDPVDINGTTGWASDQPGHPITWQVAEHTWATVGGVDTTDEALELARNLEFVDEPTWRSRYNIPAPDFATPSPDPTAATQSAAPTNTVASPATSSHTVTSQSPSNAVPTTQPTGPATSGDVIAIGDNVMLGAAGPLTEAGIVVDAAVSRQLRTAVPLVESLRDQQKPPEALIVHLGTNGTISDDELSTFFDAVRDVPRVLVLTNHADRSWTAANNDQLAALPDRYPNTTIIDWDDLADQCPGDCFYDDGIHLKPDGRTYYTNLITTALS